MKGTIKISIMALWFVFSLLALAASACEQRHSPVGVLKSKGHVVEVFTGEGSPVYSVRSARGELLAELVTEEEMLSQFPELEGIVKGYADDASLQRWTPKGPDRL